jgi:hypothetical protein
MAAAAAPAGANAAVHLARCPDSAELRFDRRRSCCRGSLLGGFRRCGRPGAVRLRLGGRQGPVDQVGRRQAACRRPRRDRGKLTSDKRKQAIESLVDEVQTAVDEGSNFAEAAGAAKLSVEATPLIMANGRSRTDPAYRAPAELAPALKAAFEIAPNDPPELVAFRTTAAIC